MKEFRTFKTEIGGREVIVETGKYCEQAGGSCIIRCGDTVVLTNTTMAAHPRDGIDFFPLGVDFEEKMYAVLKRGRVVRATRLFLFQDLSTDLSVPYSRRVCLTT